MVNYKQGGEEVAICNIGVLQLLIFNEEVEMYRIY